MKVIISGQSITLEGVIKLPSDCRPEVGIPFNPKDSECQKCQSILTGKLCSRKAQERAARTPERQ